MKFLVLLLLSNLAFANLTRDNCKAIGAGNNNLELVTEECYNYALLDSKEYERKSSPDKKLSLISWYNLVFIKSQKIVNNKIIIDVKVLRGNNTQITHIVDYAISSDNKSLYVLNKNNNHKQILVFLANRSGNVKPRIIADSSLDNAKSLAVNDSNSKLYILTDNNKILSLNSNANSSSKAAFQRPVFSELLDSVSIKHASRLLFQGDNLFILDHTNKSILKFSIKENKIVKTIPIVNLNPSSNSSLSFDKESNSIILHNNKKSISIAL